MTLVMLERLGRRVSEGPSGIAGDQAGEDGGVGAEHAQATRTAAEHAQANGIAAARTGPNLSLRQAAKAFGAVHAVVDGSIDLYPGEAHGLVGENGAGKSTLVKILGGVYQPDAGDLVIGGEPVTFAGPGSARAAGVAIIYQEPTLFPDLSVAENIFMGRQPVRAARRIDRSAMNREAIAIFAQLGVALDPGRPARGLSVADQQIVEIAKALSTICRSRSEEHTSELQSQSNLVCRLLLEKKKHRAHTTDDITIL